MVYPPIPGSPDVVEGLAAALRDEAIRVGAAQTRLGMIGPAPGGTARPGAPSLRASPSCRPSWARSPSGMPAPRLCCACSPRKFQEAQNALHPGDRPA